MVTIDDRPVREDCRELDEMIIRIVDDEKVHETVGQRYQQPNRQRKRKKFKPSSLPDTDPAYLVHLIGVRRERFRRLATQRKADWSAVETEARKAFPKLFSIVGDDGSSAVSDKQVSDIFEVLDLLWKQHHFVTKEQRIVRQHLEPSVSAKYGELRALISEDLRDGLKQFIGLDIQNLYCHQVAAIDEILCQPEKSVVVSSSTGSGKSLIFNLPIIESIIRSQFGSPVCVLYIFPTKALAQDQLRKLNCFLETCGLQDSVKAGIYDGDTVSEDRKRIRENCQIVITNPDMLHVSILPNHYLWKTFLENLSFIVVDEIHIYSGTFGSHMAFLMRRLQRATKIYRGSHPQYILCSATISNPREHSANLFNIPPSLLVPIDQDGSPRNKKLFLVLRTENCIRDAANLMLFFAECHMKSIAFCKIRKTCETLMSELGAAGGLKSKIVDKIKSYRGGYKPELRREIERMLFEGGLLGVISTNALEVGIDVGDIDVTLHLGFPGSLASLWQQAGRAGRRKKDSIAVLLLDETSSTDMYYAVHPDLLFQPKYQSLPLNLGPSSIALAQHLQCAAKEMVVNLDNDREYFGNDLNQVCEAYLEKLNDQVFIPDHKFMPHPASHFPLRSIEEEMVRVYCGSEMLEEIEVSRALFTVYQDAIYMNEGRKYYVERLDLSNGEQRAFVRPVKVSWITEPKDVTLITPGKTGQSRKIDNISLNFGPIDVQIQLLGYRKVDPTTRKIIEVVDLPSLSKYDRSTEGFWADLPQDLSPLEFESENLDLFLGIEAFAKALANYLPIVVLCKRSDILIKFPKKSGECMRLIWFDRTPSGFTKMAFEKIGEIIDNLRKELSNDQPEIEDSSPLLVSVGGPQASVEIKRTARLSLSKLFTKLFLGDAFSCFPVQAAADRPIC